MVTLGYLGPTGSYSEAVCKALYPASNYPDWKFIEYPNLTDLMNAVKCNAISLALIPTQNSKNGLLKDKEGKEFLATIAESNSELFIVNEKFWPLNFALIGAAECNINDIRTIHVNPYAHEQCQTYLSQFLHWEIVKHNSSAEAAKSAKDSGNSTHAAIASPEAAYKYELTILNKQLFKTGDEPIMHFLVLAHSNALTHLACPVEPIITSFAVNAKSGVSLNEMLKNHIEISMLRRSNISPANYYLDIKGNLTKNQLKHFLPADCDVTWLGTFTACDNRYLYEKCFSSCIE